MTTHLSKEESLIIRGIAIVCILLHNFIHHFPYTVKENEACFNPSYHPHFLDSMSHAFDSLHELHLALLNIFSYIGWYGVPIFVFLTGYGLVKKYEADGAPKLHLGRFLAANYIKFLYLLLPAIIILLGLGILDRMTDDSIFSVPSLTLVLGLPTMLSTVLYFQIPPFPMIYWYIGMTMELYIIYALAVYRRHQAWLWVLVAVTIGVQLLMIPSLSTESTANAMEYIRRNFIGWTSAFALGIIYARTSQISTRWCVAILIAALISFIPAMSHEALWQFTPLCAIVIAIAVARLSVRIPVWKQMWVWLGSISSFLFVAHPLVRQVIYGHWNPSILPSVFVPVYFFACIIAALVYRQLWRWCKEVKLRRRKVNTLSDRQKV